MDHLIKDCPLLREEQRRNSKKQQQLASKAFKKVIKATWNETFNEESEGEDVENDNLALMARSDSDSGAFNGGSISFRCEKKGMVVCICKIALQKNEDEHEIDLSQHSKVVLSATTRTCRKTTARPSLPSPSSSSPPANQRSSISVEPK
ncbi:hypothetical protein HAX54_040167 [Datura stramonium]|uniref:Uncharacterized protein n=1 Tax=Datura stramonium TaxID=4076 RepID=A0ABS8SJP8_DATST|nr:hypothetical protein [Datura stramonium]